MKHALFDSCGRPCVKLQLTGLGYPAEENCVRLRCTEVKSIGVFQLFILSATLRRPPR